MLERAGRLPIDKTSANAPFRQRCWCAKPLFRSSRVSPGNRVDECKTKLAVHRPHDLRLIKSRRHGSEQITL
jgi:hypothetical protein